MKRQTKNILKLFIICLVFILGSCQKDAYEDAIYKSNISVKRISLKNDSLQMNYKLMEAVNKVKQKYAVTQIQTNRMVYDSINNFYFDDENGKEVEMAHLKSYTFPVYRDNKVGEKVENIVFEKKENYEYVSYLVKYDFTEEELENLMVGQ